MGSLVLQNVPPSVLTQLERRAQELGVTPADEALRLLRALLGEDDQGGAEAEERASGADHLEERSGYLVFTGELEAASMPDLHELREERVDELIRRLDEAGA